MCFVFTNVRSRWSKDSKQVNTSTELVFSPWNSPVSFQNYSLNDLKTTYKGLNSRLNWPKNSKKLYCIGFCVEKLIASLVLPHILSLFFFCFLLEFHVKNPFVQVYLASYKKPISFVYSIQNKNIFSTVVPWVLPFELELPRQWFLVHKTNKKYLGILFNFEVIEDQYDTADWGNVNSFCTWKS